MANILIINEISVVFSLVFVFLEWQDWRALFKPTHKWRPQEKTVPEEDKEGGQATVTEKAINAPLDGTDLTYI